MKGPYNISEWNHRFKIARVLRYVRVEGGQVTESLWAHIYNPYWKNGLINDLLWNSLNKTPKLRLNN